MGQKQRRRLTKRERSAFGRRVQRLDQDERTSWGRDAPTAASDLDQAALTGAVLTRALVDSGLLTFTSQLKPRQWEWSAPQKLVQVL